jgi:RNase P subunit RPR2
MPVSGWGDNAFIEWIKSRPLSAQDLTRARKKLEDYKNTVLKEPLAIAPFHYRNDLFTEQNDTLCTICHGLLAHKKNRRNRSFLNQHSRFVSCETCHLDTDDLAVSYRWLAFQAPLKGQEINVSSSVHTAANSARHSMVPRPGARLVPFYQGERWMVLADEPFAREVKKQWTLNDRQNKTKLVARLHKNNRKNGLACKQCHSARQHVLDLDYLGADQKMIRAVTHNAIADFFQRYQQDDERLRLNQLLE